MYFRSSFAFLSRSTAGEYSNSNTYRIGGKQLAGDLDYDLLVRLLLTLIYNEEEDKEVMLAPAGTLLLRSRFQFHLECIFTGGAILVFMAGVPEINRVISLLEECILQVQFQYSSVRKDIVIYPLHSNLSAAEQRKVFQPLKANQIKIVIATNIAEASGKIYNSDFISFLLTFISVSAASYYIGCNCGYRQLSRKGDIL